MFTGLVRCLGRVMDLERSAGGVRLSVSTGLTGELHEGDSIAVNGVCLTATAIDGSSFDAEVMNETLARSSLAQARVGTEVNLELPLRATDRLGGHVVQGHVDGLGTVASAGDDGLARRLEIETPAQPAAIRRAEGIDRGRRRVADGGDGG